MDLHDNELPEPENFQHSLEKGEALELCAGMAQTGRRSLSRQEHETLGIERRVLWRMGLTRVFAAFFFAAVSASACYVLFPLAATAFWRAALVGLVALGALLGALVALFRACELMLRWHVLHCADKAGFVRVFEGGTNPDDYTDKSFRWLSETGLLLEDPEDQNQVELYPRHNVVYSINESEPDGWYAVLLTRAAAVPCDPLVLDAPAEWRTHASEGRVQRRRQTQMEQREIFSYIREGRRRLHIVPPLWGIAAFVAVLAMTGAVLGLNAGLSAAGASGVAAAIALQRCIVIWRSVNALDADAELGWVVIFTPDFSDEPESSDDISREHDVVMEFLPVSETLWSFSGRPAAWRYAGQPQPAEEG